MDFFNDESNVPEYVTPAPVLEHLAPAPAEHAAPAPVIECVASALANKFVASALVIEHVAPAPETALLEPPVPVVHVVQVPQVQIIEKTVQFPVVQTSQSTRTRGSLETVLVYEMKPVVTGNGGGGVTSLLPCPCLRCP